LRDSEPKKNIASRAGDLIPAGHGDDMTTDTKPLDTGSQTSLVDVASELRNALVPLNYKLKRGFAIITDDIRLITSRLLSYADTLAIEQRRIDEAAARNKDAETPATPIAKGADTLRAETEIVNTLRAELSAWKETSRSLATLNHRMQGQRDAARADVRRMTDLRDSAIAGLAACKKQAEEERAIILSELSELRDRMRIVDEAANLSARISTGAFTFLSDELDMYKAQAAEDVERIADLRAALNERDNLIIELRDRLPSEPGEPTTGPLTPAQRVQAMRLFHRLTIDASKADHLREENAKLLARLDKSEVKP
jgi:hypothetical protein